MYECEIWTIKKAEWQRIDAFELWYWRRLESYLDCKEIKQVNPQRNQPWKFIGRTDAETEASILGSPDAESQLIGKDPGDGKDQRQAEKGMTVDEMVGWHHWFNDMSLSKLWEMVKDRGAWHAAVNGLTKSQTWLSDCTTMAKGIHQETMDFNAVTLSRVSKWGVSPAAQNLLRFSMLVSCWREAQIFVWRTLLDA